MKLKLLIITLFISISVDAEWRKVNKDMYEILELNNAEIINVSSAGKDNWRLVTTIQTDYDLYRCSHSASTGMRLHSCYILTSK
jgi:hypothetical protein